MNPASPTTYAVLVAVLQRKQTSQRELSRRLEISTGLLSNVFRWLEDADLIERTGDGPESSYQLTNPTGLLRAISLFRPMERLRLFTVSVDAKKDRIHDELAGLPLVACLGTALERFSSYYRADELSFYALEGRASGTSGHLRSILKGRKPGICRVSCYRLESRMHGRRRAQATNPPQALELLRARGIAELADLRWSTTKVQTAIDLFCDGKSFAARDLLKELWGLDL